MNQVLLTLGGLTLGGSAVVALLAWAGRPGWSRYGAGWRCWGWLLLCLRLALPLPLLPQSQARAPIRMELPAPSAAAPEFPVDGGTDPGLPVQEAERPGGGVPSQAPTVPAEARPAPRPDPVHIVFALWLLGAGAVLAWNAAAHLRFLRYLRRWAAPVTDGEVIAAFNRLGDRLGLNRRPRLLVCRGLRAPMLAGVLSPAILLPRERMSGEELDLSLLHELVHYRRRDVWRKLLAVWVNALHWFNPLMWRMVRLMERDAELACDEEVLRRLPPENRSAYGQTILNAAARLQSREQKGGPHG